MEKEKNIKEEGDTMAVYEVSYLLLPSLAIEQVPAKATSLKDMVTSAGGAIIADENPVLIDLAYPMTKVVGTTRHKCNAGYFGWAKFEMSKEGIEAVKKALDANPEVLRYLIIKTVRENTLISGKMMLKKEEKVRKEDDEIISEMPEDAEVAATVPEVTEDLDKTIDDLVIA